MCFVYLTIDPTIGRIEKSSLPQQALMELFVEHIENKQTICSPGQDVESWREVYVTPTDVQRILWGSYRLGGSIQLEWLPFTAESVFVDRNNLVGTICLTELPECLQQLSVAMNRLSGTVNVTRLPPKIQGLWLNNNMFEGPTDFGWLPKTLERFNISNTMLSGEIYEFAGSYLGLKDTSVKDMREE